MSELPKLNPKDRRGKGSRGVIGVVGARVQNEDGTFAGGQKGGKERLRALEAENKALRNRLAMAEPMTITMWERSGTPEIRAQMAARAYMNEWGDTLRALKLLGFEHKEAANEELQERVFKAPDVIAILQDIMRPVKEQKAAIVARCAQIARLGDDDAAIRATAQLAKIENWVKPVENKNNVTVSLVQLMNPGAQQAGEMKQVETLVANDDVTAILGHEPGEPVRISTGDSSVEKVLLENEQ